MRAVVQTVGEAEVTVVEEGTVEGASVGRIGEGLLALLGVTHTDGDEEARRIAEKVWCLRVMKDERSASDLDAPVLLVGRFTLHADTRKGRRPSWRAGSPCSKPRPPACAASARTSRPARSAR